MPFEPGNQAAKGRTNPREFADMLRLAVKEADGDKTKLRLLADKLVSKALEGDVSALKEVADRLDGKAAQAITAEITVNPLQSLMDALDGKSRDIPAADG